MRIGKVKIESGPNVPFIVFALVLCIKDWRWGLTWLGFWLLISVTVIVYLNLPGRHE